MNHIIRSRLIGLAVILTLSLVVIGCTQEVMCSLCVLSCLKANPGVHRFLVAKYPPIENFIEKVLHKIEPISDSESIKASSQELLWEIAELIVYNKHPALSMFPGLIGEWSYFTSRFLLEER